MRVAKQFRWEAAHRLPWHTGGCQNLHGHSYRMFVEVEGEPDELGMLVDFKEIKSWLKALVGEWDHATLVFEGDDELLSVMRSTGWKHVVLPAHTTAENLCRLALDRLVETAGPRLRELGVVSVNVRIAETETCYAEDRRVID